MATLSQQIGGIVRHHRKRHAWTQGELAAKADLSVEMINRVESGRVVPSLRTLELLAGLFVIPVRDLFGIGDHAAEAGRDDAMVRLVGRVSSLDSEDLEWVDRLVAMALNRKVRPSTASQG
jgi:transcriptional regulator with XRE-family HTH domain